MRGRRFVVSGRGMPLPNWRCPSQTCDRVCIVVDLLLMVNACVAEFVKMDTATMSICSTLIRMFIKGAVIATLLSCDALWHVDITLTDHGGRERHEQYMAKFASSFARSHAPGGAHTASFAVHTALEKVHPSTASDDCHLVCRCMLLHSLSPCDSFVSQPCGSHGFPCLHAH
jgi:hypothetical protein